MKRNIENAGRTLERAVSEVREARAPQEQVDQAASRVLENLRLEFNKVVPHPAAGVAGMDRIESCEDFRSLIPAYLTSSLTPSRKLLFEDHVRECVGCRKALEDARRGSAPAPVTSVRTSGRFGMPRMRWAALVAAALVIAVAVETSPVRDWLWPIDVHAVVRAVDGGLFNVTGQQVQGLRPGERVERDETVRTGAASGAVLELGDGTRVEMAARSQLSLGRARDGVKVRLLRGNVIVKAAKQHGHLYVETPDCRVAVVGTVFSVSASVKGSRVAVIEGLVQVLQNGAEESLTPGQQTFTNPAMGAVPIQQEIAWSRDAEAWLKELAAFGQDFAARAGNQAMRYSSNLVPLAPSDTLVLASLPNVSQSFADSYALFRQRMAENTTLSGWWSTASRPSRGMSVDEVMQRIAGVGAYIGPEVVLAFPKDMSGRQPVLLAEASRPDSLVSALEGDIRRLTEANGVDPGFRLARNAEELAALSGPGIVLYVDNGLLIGSDAAQVKRTAAFQQGRATNAFAGTPLYRRLEQAYREGVGWLLAVDLQQLVSPGSEDMKLLGFENVQQLVLEQKTGVGNAASRVTLGFSQARRGLAAWLGAPAPMGALEFVSPDAYGFSSWVVKDPDLILDDFLQIANDPNAAQHLREFQNQYGVDLRRDLAEPLGNEFLVAVDGPILPTPSWKIVFEVNDAPRLENAIQWAVTTLNRQAALAQKPLWSLTSETVDGRTYHALKSKGVPMEIHYTSWAGYMIVAPSRALLTDAIQYHDSGNSIAHSAAFRGELPPDGRDVSSAIMYQNLEAMSRGIASTADAMTPDLANAVRQAAVLQTSLPKVVFAYGDQDRILGAARGAFGINFAGMIGLQGVLGASGIGIPGGH